MADAGKKIPYTGEWVGLIIATRETGKSRVFLLTKAIAGELTAKHEAGRTVISRESLDRLNESLQPKKRGRR